MRIIAFGTLGKIEKDMIGETIYQLICFEFLDFLAVSFVKDVTRC